MRTRDHVAEMCHEMGLPPPALLREAARLARSLPRCALPRVTWPPGFEAQLPALVASSSRLTPAGAVAVSEASMKRRERDAVQGIGWGGGAALPTAPAPRAPAPATTGRDRQARRGRGFEFRGESLAYRAWLLVSGDLRLPVLQVATALGATDAQLRGALVLPMRAGVFALERGLLGRGAVVPVLPAAVRRAVEA